MVYKPTNITGGPQTVWGCLKIGHPKNLSIIIFPTKLILRGVPKNPIFNHTHVLIRPKISWFFIMFRHKPIMFHHFSHHFPPCTNHFPPWNPIMFQHSSIMFPPFSHHVPTKNIIETAQKGRPRGPLGQEFIANITGEMAALANNSVTGCHHCG